MSRFNRNIIILLIGIVVVLSAIVATSKERVKLTLPEELLRDSLAPLQQGATLVSDRVGGFFESIWAYTRLKQDNQHLTKQVNQLQERVHTLEEMQFENIRLREALGFMEEEQNKFDLEPARVIARDPRNWFSTTTINRGKKDGVQKNMAVITPQGLIGRVISVSERTASVLLLLDNRSAVGGLIQINRTPGVVEGMNDKAGFVRMIHIPRDANVTIGQTVITSGLGSLFPKSIPVGKVVEVKTEPSGLLKYAIIRPFVDFNRLEEVFVIKNIYTPPTVGEEEVQ